MQVIGQGMLFSFHDCFSLIQFYDIDHVASPLFKLPFLRTSGMLSGREVSLQIPTEVSHHDCVPSLSVPDGIPPTARHSLNPGSQETVPYVKIGSAS